MSWFFELENFLLFFALLYVAYANLMIIYHKYSNNLSHKTRLVLMYGLGVPFILADVLFNIIYGTLMFAQLPNFKNRHFKYLPTFTERCADILKKEWGVQTKRPFDFWGSIKHILGHKRFYLAYFICHYLLEPWDPNHCGMESLRKASYLE